MFGSLKNFDYLCCRNSRIQEDGATVYGPKTVRVETVNLANKKPLTELIRGIKNVATFPSHHITQV